MRQAKQFPKYLLTKPRQKTFFLSLPQEGLLLDATNIPKCRKTFKTCSFCSKQKRATSTVVVNRHSKSSYFAYRAMIVLYLRWFWLLWRQCCWFYHKPTLCLFDIVLQYEAHDENECGGKLSNPTNWFMRSAPQPFGVRLNPKPPNHGGQAMKLHRGKQGGSLIAYRLSK